MKNMIERIKGFMQAFFSDAMAILYSAFTDDNPVLVPISVKSTAYDIDKRDPYRH